MRYEVFKGKVTGYKNLSKGIGSQDFIQYILQNDVIICSVADGHSTSFFRYSDRGAKLACKSSIEVLKKYINNDINELKLNLNNYNIQKEIYDRWIELVDKDYKSFNPIVFKTEFTKYSTTLLSIMVTNDYILYLKLGDGDIIVKKDGIYNKVIKIKQKGIVNALGQSKAYKNIDYYIDKNNFDNIIIFTDGYGNSFKNDKTLFLDLENTIQKYKKDVFSRNLLVEGYKKHLNYLSYLTTKDDSSIVYIFKN